MKPYILLTPRNQSKDADNRIMSDNESYFNYIKQAGGIPFLAGLMSAEEAHEAAAHFDGLLITGGMDVDPAFYHETNTYSQPIEADYEANDINLYKAFQQEHRPILAICRGIQIVAAAEGSSLIQDIPAKFNTCHDQTKLRPPVPRGQCAHRITVDPASRLFPILGEECAVNSYHHQCVKEVPDGFTCSARSIPEGIIEAMEADHILCVQWHPERLISDQAQLNIARHFIHDCSLHQAK